MGERESVEEEECDGIKENVSDGERGGEERKANRSVRSSSTYGGCCVFFERLL